MELRELIKRYREEHSLTMQQFADRCGLSKGYISMLEKGHHPQSSRALIPSLETLNKIASGMSLSVDSLLLLLDGDTSVTINENAIDPTEAELLSAFRSMNKEGQTAALAAVCGLAASDIYKKRNNSSVVLDV